MTTPQADDRKTPADSAAVLSDSVESDTTQLSRAAAAFFPPSPDSMDVQHRRIDSLMAVAHADTAKPDTAAAVVIRDFWPPSAIFDSSEHTFGRLWNIPGWDLPAPAELATGDLADWLLLVPSYDVADAPGPGQFRRFTRWGLNDRLGTWSVDGEPFAWERVTFPQRAQFDPTSLPSFAYERVEVADRVGLWHASQWPLDPHSAYFLRQGDFGETYSEGRFLRRFPMALGIDLGFTFYKSAGRFANDNRDTRHLRAQIVGPLKGNLFWSVRFHQFRDKSGVLTPQAYNAVQPHRDDLFYVVDALVYAAPSEQSLPILGMNVQSGKQDIRGQSAYHLESHDRTWTAWGQRIVRGWLLKTTGTLDRLRVGSVHRSRWGLRVQGQRNWDVNTWGTAALKASLSDWDTDPPAPEFSATVAADHAGHLLQPGIRFERRRVVPTLFDRFMPGDTVVIGGVANSGLSQYTESGDPALNAEWRNSATVFLASDTARAKLSFTAEGNLTYAQRYTRWENASSSATQADYRPVSGDARTVGIALGFHAPLRWKFETWVSYAAKYAETVAHRRLTDYYPHKGSVILSWIAPEFRYKIDLRLNSVLIWWYGDRRVIPTRYRDPYVFRWDLSGSAHMSSFTFYYSIQNVANVQYRNDANDPDYGFTGRDVRFGINWQFLD